MMDLGYIKRLTQRCASPALGVIALREAETLIRHTGKLNIGAVEKAILETFL